MSTPADIASWRNDQRERLLSRRSAITSKDRVAWNKRITRYLVDGFPCLEGMIIGFCWPREGEFDARFAIRHFRLRGALAALPVAVAHGQPLEFRAWFPEASVTPGLLGLPVPQRTPTVRPDALLIPPVGFGSRGYRLGYGGGYFGRTLASMTPQPLKIGVAFEISRLDTIYPQAHDIPMDFIVTEAGIHEVGPRGLSLIREVEKVQAAVAHLSRERTDASMALRAGSEHALTRQELVASLNALLEAGRANTKLLGKCAHDYDIGSVYWLSLTALQRSEERHCAKLAGLVQKLGGVPSGKTATFVYKGLDLDDAGDRLGFLSRGQQWTVRRIRTLLPRIADPTVLAVLKRLLISEVRAAETYETLMHTLV
ncbi:MAG: 5-formyltetrahydrofolate cyclo-ligase [Rhodospirillaceae bacterium]